MSAHKLLNQWGLLGNIEASYGEAENLDPATHGLLTMEPPRVSLEFAHDGSRNGRGPGTGGQIKRVGRSGRTGSLSIVSEFSGPAAAYAVDKLPNVHTLLRACGHSATLTADKYVYAPLANGHVSATLKAFLAGQEQVLRGAYGSLTIAAEGPVVPSFTFEMQGIADDVQDAAIPPIKYPNENVNPPKSENIALTMDGWAGGVVRSWSFTQNMPLTARLDDNVAGHAGFSPGRMDPQMEVTVEACPLATFNPYQLAETAKDFALSLVVGATKYNRFGLAAPAVQVMDVQEGEDGPTALWTLSLQLSATGFSETDMYTITAD